jgi:SAM-dependent methyltransferase
VIMLSPTIEAVHAPAPDRRSAPTCRCGSSATQILYRVPAIPVHSCVLLSSAEAARTFPRADLELAFCNECGFAFNHVFDESVMRYSTDFEESQHFSDTFNTFARQLAKDIAVRCRIQGKCVLEIGCGKGEFLVELCEAGDATGIGIDPGYRADAGRVQKRGRVEFIVDFFGPKYARLPVDAVLCRHTLEHIAPVNEFVRAIREMIGGRNDVCVVFETPDFKRVLREAAFWDIYYEHCSYFSPGAHARLFRQQAFDVTHLELAYSDQYIIQYAKAARRKTAPRLALEGDLDEMQRLAESFPGRVAAMQEQWRARICGAWTAGRSVVLWGGGSKAVSFITTLGLGQEVAAAVDINPYKQGKFLPGTGHPVVSPQSLVKRPPDMVVVMNAIYSREVALTLNSFGLEPEILSLQ